MRVKRLALLFTVFFLSLSFSAFAAMDGSTIKQHLAEALGDNSTWSAAVLVKLSKNMSYDQARAVFNQLPEKDITAKKIYVAKVKVTDNPIIENYELKFRSGKLYGAIINFKRNLDKELFKQVSLEVFENKFGKVKAEKREKDIINKFNSDGQGAQRSWLVDHWLLELDIP